MTGPDVNENGDDDETSETLLEQMRANNEQAWTDFVQLYQPLLEDWARRKRVPEHDVSTIVSDVLRDVHRSMPTYKHESFRGWLRTITVNRVKDYQTRLHKREHAQGGSEGIRRLEQQPDSADDETSNAYPLSERQVLLQRAYEQVLQRCQKHNRDIFVRVVMHNESPADVAASHGIGVDRIYTVKAQILRRIRLKLVGLLNVDDDLTIDQPPSPT